MPPPPHKLVQGYITNPSTGITEYTVRLGSLGPIAPRRFRDFLSLRSALLATDPFIPRLPSKFTQTHPAQRAPLLEGFLVRVVESSGADPSRELMAFFGIDDCLEFAEGIESIVGKRNAGDVRIVVGEWSIPLGFETQVNGAFQEVMEASEAVDGVGGWALVGNKAPFRWMARPAGTRGVKPNRVVVGVLKRCTPRLVNDLFFDTDKCMQMEPNIARVVDVERLDEHTIVQYFVMKPIMGTAARDVIMLRHWRVLNDGTIVHAEFSLRNYKGVPEADTEGRIRAVLTCGGAVISPIKGDPSSCRVARVNDMDPLLGDAIPAFALRKLNDFTCSMLSNNMFCLQKLTSEIPLAVSLAKDPLVNWNGKVEGKLAEVASVVVIEEDVSKPSSEENSILSLALTLALTYWVNSWKPLTTGFAVGMLAGVAAAMKQNC